MGTRGAAGFRIGDTDKVQYNHFDSYPDGLGRDVIDFIREHDDEEIRAAAENIRLVREDQVPSQAEIQYYVGLRTYNSGVSEQSVTDWYCLLRNTQGNLEVYLNGVEHMIDSHEFLIDSLFCEWAYIINVDTGELEVYRGFNTAPSDAGRYAAIMDVKDYRTGSGSDYYGVELLVATPLDYFRFLSDDEVSEHLEALHSLAYPDEDEDDES